MPLYLSQQTLKDAVDRLAISSVSSSIADYLIFKRALKIAKDVAQESSLPEPTSIVTGTKSAPFVQAIEEMTLRVPKERVRENMDTPYYVPFGSMRDSTRGYRSKRFPSNGSSDTVGRWQSRSAKPLVLVPGTSPKAYMFEERTKRELESFFIVKGAAEHFSGERPRLIDTALWWFRFTNLAEHFAHEPTAEQLIQTFVGDLVLDTDKLSALFATEDLNGIMVKGGDV